MVKTYLLNDNIKLLPTHSHQKAQIIERLNPAIKGIMFRYFAKKNPRMHIDILQDVATKYKASYQRSIKMLLMMFKNIKKLKPV